MTSTAIWQNWDTISGLFDRHVENATSPIYGYYAQNIFQMRDGTGVFSDKERGLFGIHYINTTGGDLDTTWTSADYAAVESAVQAFFTANLSSISGDIKLVEHRWYPFGPAVLPPNPPVRVTTLGSPITGTGSTPTAHQVATTCTFRTALRRHWGRIYTPISGVYASTGGQMGGGSVTALANTFRTLVTSPNTSQGIVPVVWDRNRKAALGVTALEVDSVPDVIRRRRPRVTANKTVLTS